MNTTVISMAQARQITGGRKPLVPVEYETACAALAQCVDLDEAKYWDNKADALAAWAKIYHDDAVARDAKRLKLKAYRRIGELAEELRPTRAGASRRGAISLIKENGFKQTQALAARRLAQMPENEFSELVSHSRPASPITAAIKRASGSGAWTKFAYEGGGVTFRSFCRRANPKDLAKEMDRSEARKARELVLDIQEWLDTFEQFLPKDG